MKYTTDIFAVDYKIIAIFEFNGIVLLGLV